MEEYPVLETYTPSSPEEAEKANTKLDGWNKAIKEVAENIRQIFHEAHDDYDRKRKGLSPCRRRVNPTKRLKNRKRNKFASMARRK